MGVDLAQSSLQVLFPAMSFGGQIWVTDTLKQVLRAECLYPPKCICLSPTPPPKHKMSWDLEMGPLGDNYVLMRS